jgi:hypothetical protein
MEQQQAHVIQRPVVVIGDAHHMHGVEAMTALLY